MSSSSLEDESYDDSEGSENSSVDESEVDSTAECIRNRSNFSMVKSFHMIDKKDYDPEILKHYIENDASPKLKLLINKIKKLDEQDMKQSGKLYKHLIFTDVNRSAYGAKIIASALSAYGLNMVLHPQGTGFAVYPDEKLLETQNSNFAVLLSKSFYERPMNVKIRKAILDKFNSRPDNIYGELIRFIILDQGFKEGIDLFDVKYVHLFEPLTVKADEKQAIGRATRFCGQKGLEFHPRYGWPLYVFKYDVEIPESHQQRYSDAKKLFELYLKYSNIDMRKIIFASELENATIDGAVDYDLTRTIHTFAIEKPPQIIKDSPNSPKIGGAQSKVPTKIMNKADMRQFIRSKFMRIRYPRIQLENQCLNGGNMVGGNCSTCSGIMPAMTGGAPNIVSFTPTQEFVRQYFQPESAYKGMLLYHSVGTGKTCTAIATATTSFVPKDYTILWVTRHTLKSDIWKNMFKQVCNLQIQKDLENGMKLPEVIKGNMKYVSNNWMEPISYKQFSNMLLKRNKIYNEIVRRNGEEDPLHKTLLIIDEAHKLYSPTVAKSEKPDTDILEKMIQNSYDKSGKDSVRVLLMTATPFTEDGMEMIRLLNLLRQKDHMPIDFKMFAETYLDDNGYFTKKGMKMFQDNISGYVSYLNRSQDARNFAHPVIQNVYAKMSVENYKMNEAKIKVKQLHEELKGLKKIVDDCMKKEKEQFKQEKERLMQEKKAEENRCGDDAQCKADVTSKYSTLLKNLKTHSDEMIQRCKETDFDTQAIAAKTAELKEYQKLLPKSKYDVMIQEAREKIKELRQQIKGLSSNKGKIKQCIADVKAEFSALDAEAKQVKKTKEEECKQLPVKERKGCKDRAVSEFKALQERYKIEKEKGIQNCNEVAGQNGPSKQELQQQIEEHKGKVNEYKDEKKGSKERIASINMKSKEFKGEIKEKTKEVKVLIAKIKAETDIIKRIRDKKERNAAMNTFRKTNEMPKQLKELKKELKDLRSKVSKNNITVKNAKLSDGRLKLQKISQEHALSKYCKI